MSDNLLPQRKMPKLIVVMAFDRNDEGELVPAIEAQQHQSEDRAVRIARALSDRHVGVIAWSREADPNLGEYREPTVLFQHGEVPDME